MSLRINLNTAALTAHRTLSETDTTLGKTIERLSSGFKINSAGDDPAGLVISEKLRAQVSGLGQAIANAGDAVNMVKTAEGALSEVSRILRSMRDLAVHAANTGANDEAAVQADQAQINNSIKSLNKIAQETMFGGRKLLDGTAGVRTYIDGTAVMTGDFSYANNLNDGAAIKINITKAAEKATLTSAATFVPLTTGQTSTSSIFASAASTMGGAGNLIVNNTTVSYVGTDKVSDVVTKINAAKATTGVEAIYNATTGAIDFSATSAGKAASFTVTDTKSTASASTSGTFAAAASTMGGVGNLLINGTTVAYATADTVTDVVADINAVKSTTGVEATFNVATGKIDLTATAAGTSGSFTATDSGATLLATTAYGTGTELLAATAYGTGTDMGTFAKKDGSMYINGVKIDYASGDDVQDLLIKVNAKSDLTKVDATYNTTTNKIEFKTKEYGATAKIQMTLASDFLGGVSAADDNGANAQAAVSKVINGIEQSVSDAVWQSGNGLELKDSLGNTIKMREAMGSVAQDYGTQFNLGVNTLKFQVGAYDNQLREVNIGSIFANELGRGAVEDESLSTINVTDKDNDGAQKAIKIMDNAIQQISSQRAALGATQKNVLESSITSLNIAKENISASESTIRDTDMAAEVVSLTKNQILQQSGVSMLAQANQMPQTLLKLLQ